MAILNQSNFHIRFKPNPSDPQKTDVAVEHGPHALYSTGLILDMTIGIDSQTSAAMAEAKQPVLAPIMVKALLDTGCTITSIDQSIVAYLNLRTHGYSQASTANGIAKCGIHTVSLSFPGTQLKGRLIHSVQSMNLGNNPFRVLIGRDLMSNWVINYNGTIGSVSIAD